jgi:class 3 adenylate cyclase
MGVSKDKETPPSGDRRAPDVASNVPPGTDVHAFLIADVRGWTSFTQARGDEDAGRLAARFAEVARQVIQEHQGEVLELRGDEALCVFGSPRSAIRNPRPARQDRQRVTAVYDRPFVDSQ